MTNWWIATSLCEIRCYGVKAHFVLYFVNKSFPVTHSQIAFFSFSRFPCLVFFILLFFLPSQKTKLKQLLYGALWVKSQSYQITKCGALASVHLLIVPLRSYLTSYQGKLLWSSETVGSSAEPLAELRSHLQSRISILSHTLCFSRAASYTAIKELSALHAWLRLTREAAVLVCVFHIKLRSIK